MGMFLVFCAEVCIYHNSPEKLFCIVGKNVVVGRHDLLI